jgi:hypothetical protein
MITVLVFDLGRNHCFRRLGCRRDDPCGLALDARGATCRHSRVAQLLRGGLGGRDRLGHGHQHWVLALSIPR